MSCIGLGYLQTWTAVGGTIWGSLGGLTLLEEIQHWSLGFVLLPLSLSDLGLYQKMRVLTSLFSLPCLSHAAVFPYHDGPLSL